MKFTPLVVYPIDDEFFIVLWLSVHLFGGISVCPDAPRQLNFCDISACTVPKPEFAIKQCGLMTHLRLNELGDH